MANNKRDFQRTDVSQRELLLFKCHPWIRVLRSALSPQLCVISAGDTRLLRRGENLDESGGEGRCFLISMGPS